MPPRSSAVVRYGFALVAAACAVAVRVLLAPILGSSGEFFLCFPAVMLSAWWGGTGPALAAIAGSALGTAWWVLPPLTSLAVEQPGQQVGLLLFIAMNAVLCVLHERVQDVRRQADAAVRTELQLREEEARRRQELDGALRESQALFREFMNHSPALAFIRDSEGKLVYVNAAYERFFGATLAELRGKPLSAVVPEAVALELRARYEQVLREDRPLEELHVIPDPAGKPHECQFHLFPITDGQGRRYVGGMALDVSEQRMLEAQLRQAQKMEAVGRLAGGVAHDFNNMLSVINGYAELLLMQTSPENPVRQPLTEVLKAGERAASLTRQLLAFSRQQVLAPRLLDLNETVEGVGSMLRRLIGEDVQLVIRLGPDPAPIVADAGQIEQVLLNLGVNARDAMPRGGQLTLEVMNVKLDEEYVGEHFEVQPGPYVLLAVSDTGGGMDQATQQRIFEPFFTTKGAGEGTGLGLATVYGIVRQSGGDIRVYSEPGHGTTFRIYFPAAGDAHPDEASEAVAGPATGTETVLLSEDDPAVRNLARTILREYGYQVLEAASGEDALRVLVTHAGPVHLLLSDVVMPGMSGRVLAEQATGRRPGLRVLFMSGYTDDAVMRHGILHGTAEFIQKPLTPTALTRRVREVLDRQ